MVGGRRRGVGVTFCCCCCSNLGKAREGIQYLRPELEIAAQHKEGAMHGQHLHPTMKEEEEEENEKEIETKTTSLCCCCSRGK